MRQARTRGFVVLLLILCSDVIAVAQTTQGFANLGKQIPAISQQIAASDGFARIKAALANQAQFSSSAPPPPITITALIANDTLGEGSPAVVVLGALGAIAALETFMLGVSVYLTLVRPEMNAARQAFRVAVAFQATMLAMTVSALGLVGNPVTTFMAQFEFFLFVVVEDTVFNAPFVCGVF
eukprot:c8205_g1_i1.p1 GENE.c8205_g1_i1~~c8205_g1_i1.p1  ORF type:complete len:182 (+),score=46.49 c8205_g1_i1:39-584(+)